MDSVEITRRVAAELHAQAVERGNDFWSPYRFAVAEADRRGIDVEQTAAGAAILNGGRAMFVRKDDLILHENIGTAFEQAFLVAHEIGHIELGDDAEDDSSAGIDPTRPAEPSPVGFDRVVDYGRRQRREVQMDLFAREFLLPRGVARALHVDDGLSASAIAKRLGAPFDVVAQQLFDALLLPPIAALSEQELPERPLNRRQTDAAAHRVEACLLEAGPGTGKTQTLSERVIGLIDDGVDPRRILLLTFSNRAAGEMAARIGRKRKDAAAAMWIGTFHAFGLDIIRRFHAELGLPVDPQLLDRTEAVELLESEISRLGLTYHRNIYDPTQIIVDMLAAISRAKDEVTGAARYAQLAEDMRRQAQTPNEIDAAVSAGEVARVYAAYETLKRQANRVDFGDLVSLPVELLERDAAIRTHLQGTYDQILVDEYQDVNRSSVRLLKALRPDGRNLWVVGDGKQSIYRFRGASSFNMARFDTQDFPGGVRKRLKKNYRSVDEVVKSFSAFAIRMIAGDLDSALDAERPSSGWKPQLRTVMSSDQQMVALADAIEEMHAAGYSYRDQAVLTTGNDKLSALGHTLERLGVPVLFLGSLFERPEVKDLLALLSILTDRRAMGLVRVACWPDFAMSLADVAATLDHLRSMESAPLAWLKSIDSLSSVSAQGRAALGRLGVALEGFAPTASPWTVLAEMVLDRTRIAARLAQSGDLADRTRGIAIWQFMNFLRVQPVAGGLPITRLLDRVRRLVRLGDERDLRQLPAAAQTLDAVRLMTIHGAKGLEFPIVHIPGLNSDTIPRTPPAPACPPPDGMIEGGIGTAIELYRAGLIEEQECLYYVALSRARDRLFLYAPTQKANGANRPLSPFLDRLNTTIDRCTTTPSRALPSTASDEAVVLNIEGPLRFNAPQIALYENCPRRFFYTHVLQTGGRRTATAFMHLHDAVRAVVNGVIAETAAIGDDILHRRIDEALAHEGLTEHGYHAEFRALASTMLRFFMSSRQNHTPLPIPAVTLTFGAEQIVVRPDDVLLRPDGRRTFRRVQTGHLRSYETKDVGAAAFVLAARQTFPGAVVELVHLSDAEIRALDLSTKDLEKQRAKLDGFLAAIRLGAFPAKASSRTCPGCPAFFICGPTPPGALPKKFP